MDLEPVIQNKVNQKMKKNIIHQCIYVESRKMLLMSLFYWEGLQTQTEKGLVGQLAEGTFFSHPESLLQVFASQETIGRHLRIWLSYQVLEKNIFFLIILKEIVNFLFPGNNNPKITVEMDLSSVLEKKKKLCKCMCSIFSMIYNGIFIIIQET